MLHDDERLSKYIYTSEAEKRENEAPGFFFSHPYA